MHVSTLRSPVQNENASIVFHLFSLPPALRIDVACTFVLVHTFITFVVESQSPHEPTFFFIYTPRKNEKSTLLHSTSRHDAILFRLRYRSACATRLSWTRKASCPRCQGRIELCHCHRVCDCWPACHIPVAPPLSHFGRCY